VFDKNDGQIWREAVDQLYQIRSFVRRGPGGRLVHEQDLRLCAQRYGDLKLAFLAVRQLIDVAIKAGIQMHLLRRAARFADDICKLRR
jgi:hypothetical protein